MYFLVLLVFVNLLTSSHSKIVFPHGYRLDNVTSPECEYAVDVVNVIDVTYSQFDNIGGIKTDLVKYSNIVLERLPESRIGLSTFTDKPIPPLGYNRTTWKDYCLSIKSTFEDSIEYLEYKVNRLQAGGGLDFPEAQFEALVRAVLSPRFEWRDTPTTPLGKAYIKVVLIATDAMAHLPDDAVEAARLDGIIQLPETPNPLIDDPSILATWENRRCHDMECPSLEQVGELLRREEVVPVFLVAPQGYTCDSPSGICPYPEFEKLAEETGDSTYLDPVLGMELLYESYLREMDVVGIVQLLGYGYEGFGEKFVDALVEIGKLPETCAPTTTATPVSSTTTVLTSTESTNTESIRTGSISTGSTTTESTSTESASTGSTTTESTGTESTSTESTSTASTSTESTSSESTSTNRPPSTSAATDLTITESTTSGPTATPCPCPACDDCSCCNVEVKVDVEVNCRNNTVTESVQYTQN